MNISVNDQGIVSIGSNKLPHAGNGILEIESKLLVNEDIDTETLAVALRLANELPHLHYYEVLHQAYKEMLRKRANKYISKL